MQPGVRSRRTAGLAAATLAGPTAWMMYAPSSKKIWKCLPGYQSFKEWEKKKSHSRPIITRTIIITKHLAKVTAIIGMASLCFFLANKREEHKLKIRKNRLEDLLSTTYEKRMNLLRRYNACCYMFQCRPHLVNPSLVDSPEKFNDALKPIQLHYQHYDETVTLANLRNEFSSLIFPDKEQSAIKKIEEDWKTRFEEASENRFKYLNSILDILAHTNLYYNIIK